MAQDVDLGWFADARPQDGFRLVQALRLGSRLTHNFKPLAFHQGMQLQTLTVPDYRRRLIGRLRPAVTGWHYPRRRMTRLPLKVVRPRALTTTAKP